MRATGSYLAPTDDAVVGRIFASGTLHLLSAAHFGGGENEWTDAALLRDAEGVPFVTGASLAGALRGFLRRRAVEGKDLDLLFGGHEDRSGQDQGDGFHSMLWVEDTFPVANTPRVVRLRDRVRIDSTRNTAFDKGKFDYEVLEPGARFSVRIHLTLHGRNAQRHARLRLLLNALLDALSGGEVRLGAHTSRGLGACEVERWRVQELDFRSLPDVLCWLRSDEPDEDCPQRCGNEEPWNALATLEPEGSLVISATLRLAGALLQRSTPLRDQINAPDVVQLTSAGKPIVSGSALAGVLRHRAHRICRTVGATEERATAIVGEIWGPLLVGDPIASPKASRLIVDEAIIQGSNYQRQTRIAIDRFTGGARESALFEEQPVWPQSEQQTTVGVRLRLTGASQDGQPSEVERGLILLLLKDLCTGDVTVGGSAAVGRGVLRGLSGRIELRVSPRKRWNWNANADDGTITFDNEPDEVENWVEAFKRFIEGANDASRSA